MMMPDGYLTGESHTALTARLNGDSTKMYLDVFGISGVSGIFLASCCLGEHSMGRRLQDVLAT